MTDATKSKETKSQLKSGKITIANSKIFCRILAPRKESIKEVIDDEIRFANEFATRESELGSEFKKLDGKFDEDEASMPVTLLQVYLLNLRGHLDGRQTRRC